MDELFKFLLANYAQYVTMVVFAAYAMSHIVQYLPVKWTAKIPDLVMTVINFLAAKHGAISAAKTDIKGNPVD